MKNRVHWLIFLVIAFGSFGTVYGFMRAVNAEQNFIIKQTAEIKMTLNQNHFTGENHSSVDNSKNQKKKQENKTSNPVATMKTNFGDIILELFAKDAPLTVNNFIKLANSGFYDGVKFHRIIKGFMIQGGDPNSKDEDWSNDGRGGPGYSFKDEINSHKLVRGVLAMANAGPDTNGSQFFIVTADSTPWLDDKHTAFGMVVSGIDTVDKIENVATDKSRGDHPIENVIIKSITVLD